MKGLDQENARWLTFDVKMWSEHRAFIELTDSATPDPSEGAQKEGRENRGWISASQIIFSDNAKPPVRIDAPIWMRLLGTEPPASLEALAARYQTAFDHALKTWRANKPSYSKGEQAHTEFLDWLLQKRVLYWPKTLVERSDEVSKHGRLAGLLAEYHRIESSIPEPVRVPAMTDGNGFDECVFIRGNPKTLGEPTPRQFLTALAHDKNTAFKQGSGRLELARCITDSSDPLLARVMVNRVWLHLFGRGIVPTPDDFGKLGDMPTHPELLDWLAQWYRTDARWSTKRLIRLLVISTTYQMSSKLADATAEQKDPDNILLHRMPIRRLEGEAIRDAVLAISGRFDDQMFGPSIPAHLTQFMEGRGRPESSGPLDGDGRRSIYLEVRRNFLSPMMRTFDSPVPFTTVGKRTVSNVPAQSLILLNDPFVLSQARLWASRVLADPKWTTEQRIDRIYSMAFARLPTREEKAKALTFFKRQALEYGLDPVKCWSDERIWTDFCHVVLNLKEFVYVQ